jgi:glycosyltransferase involved in cell wall biosynthesis
MKNYKDLITFVVPQLCTGGVEINFLNLSNKLIEEFSRIEILYQQEIDSGDYKSKFDKKVTFYKLNALNGIKIIWEMKKYYETSKPSIIVVSMYVVAIYLSIAKIFSTHKPKIIINGGNHFTSFTKKSKKIKEKYLLPFFARHCYKQSDHFVAQCNDMSRDIEAKLKIPSDKISTIYNPIVEDDILGKKFQAPSHPWINDNGNGFKLIIMAGRLVKQKRVAEFLDIFKEIYQDNNLRLLILGEGPLETAIKNKANELGIHQSVDIIPNQKNYLSYIRYSDLLVVNSEYEGLNNMIVHALSCGTSVVSTDCPVGPSEILQHGKFGKLVESGDSSQMKKKIIQELENPAFDPEQLIKRSMDFSISSSSKEFSLLIKRLIQD